MPPYAPASSALQGRNAIAHGRSPGLTTPRPAAEVLLAEVSGAIVGYAVFFTNCSTFAGRAGIYLEDLYVQPAVRGQGIGRKMLAHVARLAVERNCDRLVWSVLDWNAPAIRFYEELGAQHVSGWQQYRFTGPELTRLAESHNA